MGPPRIFGRKKRLLLLPLSRLTASHGAPTPQPSRRGRTLQARPPSAPTSPLAALGPRVSGAPPLSSFPPLPRAVHSLCTFPHPPGRPPSSSHPPLPLATTKACGLRPLKGKQGGYHWR